MENEIILRTIQRLIELKEEAQQEYNIYQIQLLFEEINELQNIIKQK